MGSHWRPKFHLMHIFARFMNGFNKPWRALGCNCCTFSLYLAPSLIISSSPAGIPYPLIPGSLLILSSSKAPHAQGRHFCPLFPSRWTICTCSLCTVFPYNTVILSPKTTSWPLTSAACLSPPSWWQYQKGSSVEILGPLDPWPFIPPDLLPSVLQQFTPMHTMSQNCSISEHFKDHSQSSFSLLSRAAPQGLLVAAPKGQVTVPLVFDPYPQISYEFWTFSVFCISKWIRISSCLNSLVKTKALHYSSPQ